MRTLVRVSLALLIALALSTPVFAQSSADRVSFNAAVGPSFANLGTTWSTIAGLDFNLNDRMTLVGEFGVLPHAPFKSDLEVTSPLGIGGISTSRVNAYHWNGNLKIRPFQADRLTPYLTAGVGSFSTDALVQNSTAGPFKVEDRRRVSDLATNVGAGVLYRFNDWIGLAADYRSFFVHREDATPHVNRFTAGLAFSLK
jgi:opacity protein-like surface antigen